MTTNSRESMNRALMVGMLVSTYHELVLSGENNEVLLSWLVSAVCEQFGQDRREIEDLTLSLDGGIFSLSGDYVLEGPAMEDFTVVMESVAKFVDNSIADVMDVANPPAELVSTMDCLVGVFKEALGESLEGAVLGVCEIKYKGHRFITSSEAGVAIESQNEKNLEEEWMWISKGRNSLIDFIRKLK